MDKKCLMLVLILFFLPFVAGDTHIVGNYKIVGESVLVEFEFHNASNLVVGIPYDVDLIESNVEYDLLEEGGFRKAVISGENVSLKYVTRAYIERSGDKYFFVIREQFSDLTDIRISLPEGGLLEDDALIFPNGYKISTDGRIITLMWDDFKDEQILISYEVLESSNNLLWIILIFILLGGYGVLYHFQNKKFKKRIKEVESKSKLKRKDRKERMKEDLTKNLFEDEKRIVEYIINKKENEVWTKEILRELNISKVKLSRKLRSLEQKEIIKKIPFGNENKIRLIKKR